MISYDKNLMGENGKQSINSVIACRAGSGCPYMDEEPWTVFALYRRYLSNHEGFYFIFSYLIHLEPCLGVTTIYEIMA